MNKQPYRRAMLKRDRDAGTYHSIAVGEAGAVGGRFAMEAKTRVIGSGPASYPAVPSSSPWHSDPVPAEEPLGIDLSAAPIVGEAHEVAASSLGEADEGMKNLSKASLDGDERSLGTTPPRGQQRRRRLSKRGME